jgi:hypothetical protein
MGNSINVPAPIGSDTVRAAPTSLSRGLLKARQDAFAGGLSGMLAMAVQVLSLMWLRTVLNYQYRHGGTSMMAALRHLYKESGVRRLYAGLGFAMIQAPLIKFGDTAANAGVLSLMNSQKETCEIPLVLKTMLASAAAAVYRLFILPIDILKVSRQVDGTKKGSELLRRKLHEQGVPALFRGAGISVALTFVKHFPWFTTYNVLDARLPQPTNTQEKIVRCAVIGMCAGTCADLVSNSVRVLKTVRQTTSKDLSYRQCVQEVVDKDGVRGLFLRGLSTKIATGAVQGMMFSILWRFGEDAYRKRFQGETAARH